MQVCSCDFRHQITDNFDGRFFEPEFMSPQDWFPEEPDVLESTRLLYDRLLALLTDGFQVDLIDCWNDEDSQLRETDVDLRLVERSAFRMFEGYCMRFTPISRSESPT